MKHPSKEPCQCGNIKSEFAERCSACTRIKVAHICPECSKEFYTPASQEKQIYCGFYCKQQGNKKLKGVAYAKAKNS